MTPVLEDPPPRAHAGAGQVAGDLFRRESARLVAMLAGWLGTHRLQLAEDVVQEALVRALQTWPYRGVPDNPAAWLTQTARNLALDVLRREQRWQEREEGIALEQERWSGTRPEDSPPPGDGDATLADDTLRMMFVCFHPQLPVEAQTALALRTLCGLSPAEIAAAFLSTEAAVAKRLVRARARIRELRLPFAVPEPAELPERVDGVLGTLYLLFNEGYKASAGEHLVREDLCQEAIRLTLLLAAHPSTRSPRTHALLALMLLNAARLPARTDDAGNLLRLHEQDRRLWNASMIQRGLHYLALAATGDSLSEYHLEAGIAACHSTARDEASTDWPRILTMYDQLVSLTDSPVAALNRAVALSRVHGAQAGLDALDAIATQSALQGYQFFHSVRGTLAAELGRTAEARRDFARAAELATLPSEREFLARRMAECR